MRETYCVPELVFLCRTIFGDLSFNKAKRIADLPRDTQHAYAAMCLRAWPDAAYDFMVEVASPERMAEFVAGNDGWLRNALTDDLVKYLDLQLDWHRENSLARWRMEEAQDAYDDERYERFREQERMGGE